MVWFTGGKLNAKRVINVSKQSIELGGNRVNQLSAGPFRDVRKTQ